MTDIEIDHLLMPDHLVQCQRCEKWRVLGCEVFYHQLEPAPPLFKDALTLLCLECRPQEH